MLQVASGTRSIYAVGLLEQRLDSVESILRGLGIDDLRGWPHHLVNFIIENTANLASAVRIIDLASDLGIESWLSPRNRNNRGVNLLVLDKWKRNERWSDLHSFAYYAFGMRFDSEWKHIIAILERNFDKIISNVRDGQDLNYIDESILTYLAKGTSNLTVSRKAIDQLASMKKYDAVSQVAITANVSHEVIDPMLEQVVMSWDRKNGPEIGKYAVDVLASERQTNALGIIAAEAKLAEVKLYSMGKISP